MTAQIKLNLSESQELELRHAYDFLTTAQELTRAAYKRIYKAIDGQPELDLRSIRKLINHADQADSIVADLGRAAHALSERYAGVYEPNCICGMSSRCTLHSKGQTNDS